jgi:H+/Cl- antiporter ClcA
LWSLKASAAYLAGFTHSVFPSYWLLPIGLPLSVWLIRTFSPDAEGHGTEAVISAVHQRSGRIDWLVAPIKLLATVVTLAVGGSVGKEGPAAQIGAALTSMFADLLRLNNEDRRRLVICGISAGFAAVFGTPVSGALFGIEVLYLGRIDYTVIFPALVAGIVSHLVCGAQQPFPPLYGDIAAIGQIRIIFVSIASGVAFGLVALMLIESMRYIERSLKRFAHVPYRVALAGGLALVGFYTLVGDQYAGLGTPTIDAMLAGTEKAVGFETLAKIFATSLTLETGGSGGILTPVFFIGTTAGSALGDVFGVSPSILAAFGLVSVLAAAANTPLAAAVMAMEVLPVNEGVYAALAAVTAYLIVGHRSVYPSQKLGFSKSGALDVPLGGAIGDVDMTSLKIRKGSLTERVHNLGRTTSPEEDS